MNLKSKIIIAILVLYLIGSGITIYFLATKKRRFKRKGGTKGYMS